MMIGFSDLQFILKRTFGRKNLNEQFLHQLADFELRQKWQNVRIYERRKNLPTLSLDQISE